VQKEKKNMGLGGDGWLCKYSVTEVEDTLYVLRDCSFANLDAIIT
jgi:hypothetical protein